MGVNETVWYLKLPGKFVIPVSNVSWRRQLVFLETQTELILLQCNGVNCPQPVSIKMVVSFILLFMCSLKCVVFYRRYTIPIINNHFVSGIHTNKHNFEQRIATRYTSAHRQSVTCCSRKKPIVLVLFCNLKTNQLHRFGYFLKCKINNTNTKEK